MGEVVDLDAWRRDQQPAEAPRPRRRRRRRTPGGWGFEGDPTRHLSSGAPLPDPRTAPDETGQER